MNADKKKLLGRSDLKGGNVSKQIDSDETKIQVVDLYTKAVLTAIAVLLGVLALRPAVSPVSVQAQSEVSDLYIEPGIIGIRKPDGGTQGEGKMVIDRRTGDVWGFPTILAGAPYPIDGGSSKPPTSKPTYLGRFDFSAIKRIP
jgi:hypothetical protein